MGRKVLRQYRQGDVLLVPVVKVPDRATPHERDGGRAVLAYGEVTGHAHAITEPSALLFDRFGDLYLQADGSVTLRHEEHAPISIEPGVYRVVRQRQWESGYVRD
jgi:hypothetical protein